MKNHHGACVCENCYSSMRSGFTRRDTYEQENIAKWDPIVDVYRGNCVCGKWLVIPKTFTIDRPLTCHGSCDGCEKKCGREWYWVDGNRVQYQVPKTSEATVVQVKRPSWDSIWMDLAHSLSKRSTCSRLQVGCVIVSDDNHRILSVGYNGGGKGQENSCSSAEPGNCGCIHAEDNSFLKCDYGDKSRKILYVTRSPCIYCAKRAVNAGIHEVVYDLDYRLTDGIDYIKKAGIILRKYER